MTNAKRKPFLTTRELATVAILAAISAVLFMIEIPVVLFYKLDLSHLPVLLGTFAMGPVPGTLILLVKSLLGLLHSSSGMPVEAIVGMGTAIIPAVDSTLKFVLLITAPFNLLKWVLISALTGLMYKPLSPILHGRKRAKTEAKAN